MDILSIRAEVLPGLHPFSAGRFLQLCWGIPSGPSSRVGDFFPLELRTSLWVQLIPLVPSLQCIAQKRNSDSETAPSCRVALFGVQEELGSALVFLDPLFPG